jgi:hypothetical protein
MLLADDTGGASMVTEVTWVNQTGSPSTLPSDVTLAFTNASGSYVGEPVMINSSSSSVWGYSPQVNSPGFNGQNVEKTSLFNPGQTITEQPDNGGIPTASAQPNMSCQVSP